jgi:hypothetical protein
MNSKTLISTIFAIILGAGPVQAQPGGMHVNHAGLGPASQPELVGLAR